MNTAARSGWMPVALAAMCALLLAAVFCNSFRHQPAATAPETAPTEMVAHTKSRVPSIARSSEESRAATLEPIRAKYRALLAAALAEANPIEHSWRFSMALRDWFAVDFEGALAYARTAPPEFYRQGLFMAVNQMDSVNPTRALALACEMATNSEQRQIFSTLFSSLSATNLFDAVPVGEEHDLALRALASSAARNDPEAGLAWAQTLSDTNDRALAAEISLVGMAAQDPKRAINLATQSLTGEGFDHVVRAGLIQILPTDPQTVGQMTTLLPPGQLQTEMALDVARVLANQQTETALAWLPSLPTPELRQQALNNVLDVWVGHSLADASAYVTQMPVGDDQDAAVAHLSHAYGFADPVKAMEWADTLPSDSAQRAAVANIVSGWAEQDPVAATLWSENLPADNPVRLDSLRGAYSYWQLADAAAAKAFALSLPPSEQQQLTKN